MKNMQTHAMKTEDGLIMKMTMTFLVTPLLFLVVAGAVIAV